MYSKYSGHKMTQNIHTQITCIIPTHSHTHVQHTLTTHPDVLNVHTVAYYHRKYNDHCHIPDYEYLLSRNVL